MPLSTLDKITPPPQNNMRAPLPPKKLFGLDHLRTLAIALVFLFHYRMFNHPAWIDDVGSFGWTGVDLFFVLSGYLIAGQLFNSVSQGKNISLKEFFIKRFFRIIPAYATVVAIYFLLPAFHEREALPPLWKFATFTQNFGLNLRTHGTFSHAWSLCIEEQFYLLLPLIITSFLYFKAGKKAAWLIGALFIGGFLLRFISWHNMVEPLIDKDGFGFTWYKWIYYPTYNRLDGLLVGISIAGLFQFYPSFKEKMTRHGNLLLLTGLIVLTGCYFLCEDPYTFAASIAGFPAVAIGYGFLVMAAVSSSCFLYRVNSRITTAIATLSYGTYLTHKGVVHLAQQYLGKWGIAADGTLMFLLCIVIAALGALLLRHIIEKPFLKIRDRVLATRKPFVTVEKT